MFSIKKILSAGFALAMLYVGSAHADYPTEISYNVINNSNVNLTGVAAHTTLPASTLSFPANKTYAYTVNFGVENTPVRLCVGIGINNFTNPYVGAYVLKTTECPVAVEVQKNADTSFTVIVSDSK